MVCFSSFRASRPGVVFSAAIYFLVVSPNFTYAQENSQPAAARTVPTFSALPHGSLPKDRKFKIWCGTRDRYLLELDGALEAYDAGVKYAAIAVSSSWPMQCSEDGQQLIYVDTKMGYVTKVDIANGTSRLLASYDVSNTEDGRLSFSPDLQRIASNTPVRLTSDATNLSVTLVKAANGTHAKDIRWSADGSRFFVAYTRTIDVFDANGNKIGAGPAPKDTYFRDGWFETGQQSLVVFLALDDDESGPGRAIRCRIADWKCDRLQSRANSAATGGRGLWATVGPLGKPLTAGDDGNVIYPSYAAELRDRASNLLAREVLLTKSGQYDFNIDISPSGALAVLAWNRTTSEKCAARDARSIDCDRGIWVDLSKVIK